MGKNIISQRRGRGSPTYRGRPMKFVPRLSYSGKSGEVIDIIRYTPKRAPLAVVKYDDGTKGYIIAPEGVKVGDSVGSLIMPLSRVPVGGSVFAIERSPMMGPKFCMSPGSAAFLLSREGRKVRLKMPSKAERVFSGECLAVVGRPAGEGRTEKPFMLAGSKYKFMKAMGKLYPRTKAVNMNAVDHPFGGGGTGKKKPPVSRHAPPGAKVGSIAARRTGRRKK